MVSRHKINEFLDTIFIAALLSCRSLAKDLQLEHVYYTNLIHVSFHHSVNNIEFNQKNLKADLIIVVHGAACIMLTSQN